MSTYGPPPPYDQPGQPGPQPPYQRPGGPYEQPRVQYPPPPQPPNPYAPPAYPATGPSPPATASTPPALVHRPIPVVTMDAVPERAIRAVIGEVVGVVTRPRDLPPGSGDLVERYAAMLTRSRQDAVTRLIDMAVAAGADAIVGLRYDSSEITQGLSEVAAYGTAVQLAPTAGSRPVGSRSVGSSAASGPHPASDDKVTS